MLDEKHTGVDEAHEVLSRGVVFSIIPTMSTTVSQLAYQYGNIIRTFMPTLSRGPRTR